MHRAVIQLGKLESRRGSPTMQYTARKRWAFDLISGSCERRRNWPGMLASGPGDVAKTRHVPHRPPSARGRSCKLKICVYLITASSRALGPDTNIQYVDVREPKGSVCAGPLGAFKKRIHDHVSESECLKLCRPVARWYYIDSCSIVCVRVAWGQENVFEHKSPHPTSPGLPA